MFDCGVYAQCFFIYELLRKFELESTIKIQNIMFENVQRKAQNKIKLDQINAIDPFLNQQLQYIVEKDLPEDMEVFINSRIRDQYVLDSLDPETARYMECASSCMPRTFKTFEHEMSYFKHENFDDTIL